MDLGAGSCAQAPSLFAVLRPAAGEAVDISVDDLRGAMNPLQQCHTGPPMLGLALDFSAGLALPPPATDGLLRVWPAPSAASQASSCAGVCARASARTTVQAQRACSTGRLRSATMSDTAAPMKKPSLCIVTPSLADGNNGNWQTARRWARWLAGHHRVRLAKQWPDGPTVDDGTDILLALHARRSAASVAAWAQAHPGRPLVLALTGTDLYRDIATDASAQQSLALAHRLVVLQEQGPQALPEALRNKCHVVFQSSTARQTLPKTHAHLRTVMVGHLREEKSPQTLFEAARLIQPGEGIYLDHVGQALDPALGDAARQTQRDCLHYRWLGGQPHAATRGRIQRAHLLVHPSRMEGGAHVIMEAVLGGTPVLASRVPGNVGMLGSGHCGYFPFGDAAALVALLRACRAGQTRPDGGLLAVLHAQSSARAPLFEPEAERDALLALLKALR